MRPACFSRGTALLVVLAFLCAGPHASTAQPTEPPANQPADDTSQVSDPSADRTGQQAGQQTGQQPAGVGSMNAAVPTDAEILHIFRTHNQGEILTSQPATDAESDRVQEYARHMIEAHTAVVQRTDSLAG